MCVWECPAKSQSCCPELLRQWQDARPAELQQRFLTTQ